MPSTFISVTQRLDSLLNPFQKVQITIETPYSTRYFVVKLKNDTVTHVSTENIAAVTDKIAINYASQIYNTDPG